MNNKYEELKRLDFEFYIWLVIALLAFFNIFADNLQKKFLKTNNKLYESKANKIYLFVLGVSLIIYIYFFVRNYNSYKVASSEDKSLIIVKLIGSSLIIAGALCLIYFQYKNTDFIGTPAI